MRPRLALVSNGIRRDLLAPLRYFSKFELVHFYRRAEYGDLTTADLDASLRSYHSPYDLYRQLVRCDPEVIQGVEPFSFALQPCLWACFLAAREARALLIAVTLENRPLDLKFGRILAFVMRSVLRVYFDRASLVIPLNEGARRNAAACGVAPARIHRLMWGTWGVDLDEYSPQPRPADRPPTILFAGRLIEEKGIFVLLDAFAQVGSAQPEARLVVVGDGIARREAERRAEALKGVTFTGVVKNRMMPELLRGADVVAVPSLTTRKWEEQVGMVALQAMACGVPVVASRSGAIPEYVPEVAGILVVERDAPALADALLRILSDRKLGQSLGAAGRKYAVEHYDARDAVLQAQELLIQQLTGR